MIFGIINSFRSRIKNRPDWWSDCLLAMNFDGGAGSRTFIDYSPYRRKFAGASGAKIITSDKKFGSGSFQSGSYDSLGTSGGSPDGFQLTGNLTIQAFVKIPTFTTAMGFSLGCIGNESSGRWEISLNYTSGGVLNAASNVYGVSEYNPVNISLSPDVWGHICWVRVGTTITVYANGVSQGSYTQLGTLGNSNFLVQPYSNNGQFLIDDLTIINRAIYTANFTPPAQSQVHTGLDGWFPRAVLALGFNGANESTAMVDSSPIAVDPTNTGAIQVTSTDPAYGAGAGNFAGVALSEHLTLGGTANAALNGSCTIEFMFKRIGVPPDGTATAPYHTVLSKPVDSAGGERGIGISDSNGSVSILQGPAFDGQTFDTQSTNLVDGNWHHVAVSVGPITRIFVDGGLIFSRKRLSSGNVFGGAAGWIGGPSVIHSGSLDYVSGINAHLDNLIISAGQHYDGSFIPPTTYPIGSSDPYWAQTSLLLQFPGSDNSTTFTDDGPDNITLSAIGNAKIRSVSGENYLEIDGSGDGLQIAASDAFDFGTGNFTVEVEPLFTTLPADGYSRTFVDTRGSMGWEPFTLSIANASGLITINGLLGGDSSYSFKAYPHIPIVAGQRYHIAYVRSSGRFTVFLDGTPLPLTSGTESILVAANLNTTTSAKIGVAKDSSTSAIDGRIYKFRVTKAARYVAQIEQPDNGYIH